MHNKLKKSLSVAFVSFIVVGISFYAFAENLSYRQIEAEKAFLNDLKGLDIQNSTSESINNMANSAAKKADGRKTEVDAYTKLLYENLNSQYKGNKLWPEIMPSQIEDMIEANSGKSSDKYSKKHVYIFISSSMPIDLIKKYIFSVDGNDSFVFVLNGLIGNDIRYIKPTVEWINKVLCDENDKENCYSATVDVNSNLFEMFSVDEVPSIVYVKNPQSLNDCDTDKKVDHLKYVGDTDIMYVFDRFLAEEKNDVLLSEIRSQLMNKFFK